MRMDAMNADENRTWKKGKEKNIELCANGLLCWSAIVNTVFAKGLNCMKRISEQSHNFTQN